jgi:RecA-family ATPase
MKGGMIDLEHVEPIDFIIDDMLSPGLSMLAADPKIGKSWFSLLMCLCVSQGRKFLGYNTHKCNVLYLALEDSDNRMKSRIKRIFEGDKLPDTFNYCIEINDLSSGFIEQMELVCQSMSDLRLIVVDTLQCIRGQYNNKDGGAYGYDYKEMNKLKSFAKKHNLAILLIHHTSKMDNPNDPFFSISGTRGLTGALDLLMVIKKENVSDKQAKLYIRGRDVDNDAFVIEMQDCRWAKVGTLEEMQERDTLRQYQNNPIVRAVNKALEESGQWRGRMTELIEFAEQNGIHINFTPQQLSKEINSLEYQLRMIEGIEHGTVGNGKGSSPHVFKKCKQ